VATFQEVQDRINNEYLNRGTFIEETKTGIRAAIRHYSYRRLIFNETSVAVATSAGVSYVAFPNNFLILDKLEITINGFEIPLNRRDRDYILTMNATRATGQPTDYALYQNRINLALIPDAAYALPVHYLKQLPDLASAGSTNAFLDGAWQDVICYHAAKIVWAVCLRNDTEAAKFANLEQMALPTAQSHTEQYGTGKLTPTSF
jgi:hypothetical protein